MDVVRLKTGLSFVALAALSVYAVVRVVDLAWTCDDAFITYRYARHLVEGHGLVFNLGERVEGYTNFLFTILVAVAMRLGYEPRLSSMVLGAAAYFGTGALLARTAYTRRSGGGSFLPVGAALWLIQDDLHIWATGGLETTLFTFFAFTGVDRLVCARGGASLGAILLSLACLTRPDGIVFAGGGLAAYALLLSAAAHERGTGPGKPGEGFASAMARAVVPLLVIIGAFIGFKLWYYGRLLPTAFYAKSATIPYYSQGLTYVALYGAKHWAFAVALVALPLAVAASGRLSTLLAERDAIIALAIGTLFAAYVAHSGGDYMFARRLVPALPFFFRFIDHAISALPPRGAATAAVAIAGASFFPRQFAPGDAASAHGIVDERSFYPEPVIAMHRRQAELTHDVLGTHRIPAAFGGGMCMFAYYSDLPYLVEPNGLTQYWIAERPLAARGKKIGHEKAVSFELLRQHGIKLVFHHDLPPLAPEPAFNEMFIAESVRVELLTYDDDLMNTLGRDPRVRFHRIDDVLREAQSDLSAMTCPDARASFEVLSRYYLDRHPEKAAVLHRVVEGVCRP